MTLLLAIYGFTAGLYVGRFWARKKADIERARDRSKRLRSGEALNIARLTELN
jgi:hypothetical protein